MIRYLKNVQSIEEIKFLEKDKYIAKQCEMVVRPLNYDYIFGRYNPLDIHVFEGSILEPDMRFQNLDAIICIELIEHLEINELERFVSQIFGYFSPRLVYITTPNRDYNQLFPNYEPEMMRHVDHKFEFSQVEFVDWCRRVVQMFPNYQYDITGVGDPPSDKQEYGFCTQISVFRKTNSNLTECPPIINYHLLSSYHIEKKPQKTSLDSTFDWTIVKVEPNSETCEEPTD